MFRRLLLQAVAWSLSALSAAGVASEHAPVSATTIDGKAFRIPATQGQVTIVNFWATWCAPCRAEMPALDAYYRVHQHDGLALIAISVDEGVSTKKLATVTSRFAFTVARLDDVRMPRSDIPAALPTTRIYGRDGSLRFDSSTSKGAPLNDATLQRVVTPLLAEPVPTTR